MLAAERIAGRSRTRQIRLTLASGAYLVLATIAALTVVWPTSEHLAHIGAGSWDGSIALAAIALAGIALLLRHAMGAAAGARGALAVARAGDRVPAGVGAGCRAGGRRLRRDRGGAVRLPPLEADDLLAARRHGAGDRRRLVDRRRRGGARRHRRRSSDLVAADWSGFGAREGMVGLAALLVSGCVLAWSIRRPRRQLVEHGVLVPVADARVHVRRGARDAVRDLVVAGAAPACWRPPSRCRSCGAC